MFISASSISYFRNPQFSFTFNFLLMVLWPRKIFESSGHGYSVCVFDRELSITLLIICNIRSCLNATFLSIFKYL